MSLSYQRVLGLAREYSEIKKFLSAIDGPDWSGAEIIIQINRAEIPRHPVRIPAVTVSHSDSPDLYCSLLETLEERLDTIKHEVCDE